jgi:cell division protein YceG involved in septum cleavage
MDDIGCWSVAFIIIVGALLLVSLIVSRCKKAQEEQEKEDEQLKALWNQIHTGMTKEEVTGILGQPKKVREPTLFRSALRFGPIEEWSHYCPVEVN